MTFSDVGSTPTASTNFLHPERSEGSLADHKSFILERMIRVGENQSCGT